MQLSQSDQRDTLRLDLPADYKYLGALGAFLTAVIARATGTDRLDSVLAYNVELAVQEICTNIVDHAYAGDHNGRIGVTLTLENQPLRLAIELTDTGRSFDLASIEAPDLTGAHVRGYGLVIVRGLVDDLAYSHQAGLNRWRVVKNL